jgi:DNA polymerase elongation subunit (family B)
VNAFLPKEFKTEYLTMESEEYEGLIVIDEKNHIYRDKKGKTVKHGSTILGRSIPRVVDRFIDELADALFKKTDPIDVLRSWSKRRVSTYPTKDFVSYKTLSKRPDQYHSTTMYAHLIKTLKNAGISARYGERINYVKTKTYGYVPTPLLKDFMAIDYDYYVSYMCGIAEKILKKPAKELKNHFDQNVRLSKWQ